MRRPSPLQKRRGRPSPDNIVVKINGKGKLHAVFHKKIVLPAAVTTNRLVAACGRRTL